MACRFTKPEKWDDVWFGSLSVHAKLLFLYLCDRCDYAGFWEINTRDAAFRTSIPEGEIEGLLDELGDKVVRNCRFLWLKNFLLHQKNIPLNPANKVHAAIIKRLHEFEDLSDEIKSLLGQGRGSMSPTGKGNGKGSSKDGGVGEGIGAEFESWWSGADGEPPYPRRVNKKKAGEEYASVRKNKRATKEQLAIGKRHYSQALANDKTTEKFIAYPSTWLHQERWVDYQEPPKPPIQDSEDEWIVEQCEQYRQCRSRARGCAADIALERTRDELTEEDRQKIAELEAARIRHEERAAEIKARLREKGVSVDEKERVR